jgi:hypothetical protein
MMVRRMRDHAHHGMKILLLLGKERAESCYSRSSLSLGWGKRKRYGSRINNCSTVIRNHRSGTSGSSLTDSHCIICIPLNTPRAVRIYGIREGPSLEPSQHNRFMEPKELILPPPWGLSHFFLK